MDKNLLDILKLTRNIICKYIIPIKLLIIGSNKRELIRNTDIDIIVVVPNNTDNYLLIKNIATEIKNLIIERKILISIYPIKESTYKLNSTEFIRNVSKTGIEF